MLAPGTLLAHADLSRHPCRAHHGVQGKSQHQAHQASCLVVSRQGV